jgi:hypothetical protein
MTEPNGQSQSAKPNKFKAVSKPRPPSRRELAARAERARLEYEATEYEVATAALRMVSGYVPEAEVYGRQARDRQRQRHLSEAWGDPVDPYEYLNDDPGFHSAARPLVFSESDLRDIRTAARIIAVGDPTGVGIVDKLTNYTVRTGFTYTVEVKKDVAAPVGLVEEVQRLIDNVRELNHWDNRLDRESFATAHIDGAHVLTLHPDEYGDTLFRVLDVDQIREPVELPPYGRSWSYGIDTDADDIQNVHGYCVQWPDGMDWLPADQVWHVKLNVRSTVKQGLSDFYPTRADLVDAAKLKRNTVRGSQVQAAIAYIREHPPGTTKSGIEALRSEKATTETTRNYQTGAKTIYHRKFDPGTIIDTVGTKYQAGPLGTSNGPNFIAVLQAGWRAAAQRWSMPEYLVSSDASNANYSSTLVAGEPFTIYCEQQQALFSEEFVSLLWRCVAFAHRAGRFFQYGVTLTDLKRFLQIKATPPDIVVRDKSVETTRRQTLHASRVIGLETWRKEEGYDPDEQEQQVAKEPVPAALPGVAAMPDGSVDGQPVPVATTDTVIPPAATDQEIQVSTDLMLNGAQVQAATAIVTAVATGVIPRDAGLGQLKILFNLSDQQASDIMGSAGTTVPTTANPTTSGSKSVETTLPESRHDRLTLANRCLWEGYP